MNIFSHLIQVEYCYNYLINQIPVGLLVYSHIPTAVIAVIFGGFLLYKVRNLESMTLFVVCVSFAIWCFLDLSSWFAFLGSNITMFTWSLVDLFALLFFFFSYYFLFTFLMRRDLFAWQKIVGVLFLLPTAISTLFGYNLLSFDANQCQVNEREWVALYPYFVEGVIVLAVLVLAFICIRKATTQRQRTEALLASTGVFLFLFFFFLSTLGVNVLVNYFDISTYAYNFEIYGLFGMPILLIYLGYLIVKYNEFNLKIFGTEALVFALLALIASEFAFVNTVTNRILISITLVLTAAIGYILVKSVQKEIEQRMNIQQLASNLQNANKQQIVLIHFITHQIKGYLTKSRNIFSMALEGDFGKLPDAFLPLATEGLSSATNGVNTVQEILNASNLKSGAVSYIFKSFNLTELIQKIISELMPAATKKGLSLVCNSENAVQQVIGDEAQLYNAFKNLIDNSIKYTPSGSVTINLESKPDKVIFTIKDTGVGITAEDMSHLFTEGGHGKDSVKVNTESTGFGLYIVKNIIDAHHGKIWAESEGSGKGSTFTIELSLTDVAPTAPEINSEVSK